MKRLNRIFSLIIGILMATAAIAQETETGGQAFFGENGEIASNLPTSIPLKDRKPIEYNNPRADDIIWSKVIYRVIDMHEKINYPLYFPTMASDNRQSLFTTISRLFEEGKIQAYEFEADREIFTEDRLVKFEDFLAKNEIMVEAEVDSITGDTLSTYIDESNIPNVEVLKYYLKEVWYFDKNNSTFSVRILAICPKIYRENYDMGGQLVGYPQFWVPFDQLRPYLAQQEALTSDRNNGARETMDDLFIKRRFGSYIYKESNTRNRNLIQYNSNAEEAHREQERIKNEIINFEQDLWEY